MKALNAFTASVFAIVFVFGLGVSTALAAGPAAVNLASAGNFVVLSETGITDVPASIITGNIGTSPISGAAIGVTCPEVTGSIYAVDAAGPLPCSINDATTLTAAVNDMMTAYTDAAGRTIPDATELGAGNIGGMTLAPGLYKWSTDVTIPTSVTLSGGANDVWIFQIAGNLSIASAQSVILTGGAQASHVFWQVGGVTGATLGTTSTFNGTILSAKQVIIQTGATLNGRALAQTQVTLDHSTILFPTTAAVVVVATPVVTSSSGGSNGSSPVQQNLASQNQANAQTGTTVTTTTTVNTTAPVVAPHLPNTGFAPETSQISSFLTMLMNFAK